MKWMIAIAITLLALAAVAVAVELRETARNKKALDMCIEYAKEHVPDVLPDAWCQG